MSVFPRLASAPSLVRTLSVPPEFLSEQECKALLDTVASLATGGGVSTISLESQWLGGVQWVRNRTRVASDLRFNSLGLNRLIRGRSQWITTTRLDTDGLRDAVKAAERSIRFFGPRHEWDDRMQYNNDPMLQPILWSEATYGFSPERRLGLVRDLVGMAETDGFLSAGDVGVTAQGTATVSTDGRLRYYASTEAECSITVRDRRGTASGWAGVNHYDFAKIDPAKIAATALDKARRSAQAVAIEPQHYTAILEPQAVSDLMVPLTAWLARDKAEQGLGPFAGRQPGTSKINERVMDPRLTLRSDPLDPDGGFIPFDADDGTPYRSVNWIEAGVLRELAYGRYYAVTMLHQPFPLLNPMSFRLTPVPGVSTASVETMIANTQLGVLVTRFNGVQILDIDSITCGGNTRDGLWLIEKGKISKAIRNFRFRDSVLGALNRIEQIGVPCRVFTPGRACVMPALTVRDFNFTGLADAV